MDPEFCLEFRSVEKVCPVASVRPQLHSSSSAAVAIYEDCLGSAKTQMARDDKTYLFIRPTDLLASISAFGITGQNNISIVYSRVRYLESIRNSFV